MLTCWCVSLYDHINYNPNWFRSFGDEVSLVAPYSLGSINLILLAVMDGLTSDQQYKVKLSLNLIQCDVIQQLTPGIIKTSSKDTFTIFGR